MGTKTRPSTTNSTTDCRFRGGASRTYRLRSPWRWPSSTASPTASIWVVNAFQLAVTATLFTFASLGGLKGSARVYRVGVIVFILGSLFSALSRSLPELIAARALQGIGASGIMSLSPALLRDIFPSSQLGRALGLNALVVATAAAAGPTVGGLLLSVSSWPILFAVNIPLGLANVVLNRALPDDRRNEGQLDVPSAISSALGFALTIYGLDGFAHNEPPAMIAIPLAIGLISGWYFVRRQFRLPRPMIALDLFHVPTFAIASATSLATFTAQGIAYVALPFFFQVALGRTPLQSGLLLSSWPLATAIVAPIAGRLSDRYPVGILATIGLAVLTIGLTSYARLPPDPSTTAIVTHAMICGLGFGFFQSPNNREIIGTAPRAKTTSASGILAAVRVSGQTLGAALVAIVFGVFGAHAVAGESAARDAVIRAAPTALALAAWCAGLATVASGLRLLRRSR
jgi:MFS transporter, DHA2 family, multidrug resistance protein